MFVLNGNNSKALPKRSSLEGHDRQVLFKGHTELTKKKVSVGVVVIIKGIVMEYWQFPGRFNIWFDHKEALPDFLLHWLHKILNGGVWAFLKFCSITLQLSIETRLEVSLPAAFNLFAYELLRGAWEASTRDMVLSAGFLSKIMELSQQNSVISCLFTKEQWNTFSLRGICSYNKNSSQRKTLCLMVLVITLLCADQLYETRLKNMRTSNKVNPFNHLSLPLSFLPCFLPPPLFLPSSFPLSLFLSLLFSPSLLLSLFLSTPLSIPPLDARQALYSLSCSSRPGLFPFIGFMNTAV